MISTKGRATIFLSVIAAGYLIAAVAFLCPIVHLFVLIEQIKEGDTNVVILPVWAFLAVSAICFIGATLVLIFFVVWQARLRSRLLDGGGGYK